jgi:alkylation response protein AidB-like acyl-CoA dehydrogenase
MVLDTIRALPREYLSKERVLQLDDHSTFPLELLRELLSERVGLQLVFIPVEYGGLGGGAEDIFHVSVELARICLGVATSFLAIHLGAEPILLAGTEEQKQHWLGRLASEGLIFAYAVTEADAGSNLEALKTKAEPVMENGQVRGYLLNGSKQFISNGGFADVLTVLARTPEGPTFFIVPGDASGLTRGAPEHKHGIRAANTAPLSFENVFVPVENVVGGVPGQGIKQSNAVFAYTRLMVAAFGYGAGRSALEKAGAFARDRIQFGTPLIQKEGYVNKLFVPHLARLEVMRTYIESIARQIDNGATDIMVEGSIAKYLATEFGNSAAEAAIQAMGGYGYMHDYVVEKIKRDVRITMIYEGTNEIQQNIIYLFRWKNTIRTKGACYQELAEKLRACNAEHTARLVQLTSDLILFAHQNNLTKSQHVQFLLSDLIAYSEAAAQVALQLAGTPAVTSAQYQYQTNCWQVFLSEATMKVWQNAHEIVLGSPSIGTEARSAWLERLQQLALPQAFTNLLPVKQQVLDYFINHLV